jgi:hypothetical protein
MFLCLLAAMLTACCPPSGEPVGNPPPATSPAEAESPVSIDFALVQPADSEAEFKSETLLVIPAGHLPVGIQPRVTAAGDAMNQPVDVIVELVRTVGPADKELDYQRLRGVDLGAMRLAGKVMAVPPETPGRLYMRVEVRRGAHEVIARDVLHIQIIDE